ncbi:MAG: hypothetical protein EI684_09240 [Candidatus Viridilinea halotolerans]|uniref:HNH endonuclease n=1 Tax=Candidatus Viridilinea halotolerans TaxID=2491704 RepID=A0A426U1K4_9CHLR|nr:MAG: hypothetical protein EI684_09240 [Candidatus Viridilinea halotolerans]
MLYKVNVPLCREHLVWIVDLQRQFLSKLCDSTVTARIVDEDWVVAQMPHLEEKWVRSFCRGKDKISRVGRPLIGHMQFIAGVDLPMKEVIIDSFEHDIQLLIDIEQGNPAAHPLHGLAKIGDAAVREAVRGLLETFYNPQFYANHGYNVPLGGAAGHFHKDVFRREFDVANPDVVVCPLCDGPRNTEQVDHIYPKSLYPFLSCHPLNLVPICFQCNKLDAKGDKPPLNNDDIDPTEKWLHPYLRPLLDWAQTEDLPAKDLFSTEFSRINDETLPYLVSQDPLIAEQLKNLDNLVKLTREWKKVLAITIREQQRNIRRFKHRQAPYIDEDLLRSKLQEWAEDRRRGIGIDPHAILHSYYYAATQDVAALFEEIWLYSEHMS